MLNGGDNRCPVQTKLSSTLGPLLSNFQPKNRTR